MRAHGLGLAVLLGAAVLTGAGCAADMPKHDAEKEAEAVPRPEWRLGDRWMFQRTIPGGPSGVVTHQVVAATQEGYTIRVSGFGPEVTRRWTPELHLAQETSGAGMTTRHDPPASYFVWPLRLAQTWSQEFQYTDGRADGRYANTWKVGATIETIDAVAGRFYALRIERWSGTQRLESYWYSPRIRYWVRLEDNLRGYVEELVEFRPLGSGATPQ